MLKRGATFVGSLLWKVVSTVKNIKNTWRKDNTIVDTYNKIPSHRYSSKYEIEFKDFFIPLQDCIERDSKRPNPIGEEVIRKTYEKYKDILKV